jgi:hypothetical protein
VSYRAVTPGQLDRPRQSFTHLVLARSPGVSRPHGGRQAAHEAVEFPPVASHGPHVDGTAVCSLGFRVQGVGFGVHVDGTAVCSLGFMVYGLWFRV